MNDEIIIKQSGCSAHITHRGFTLRSREYSCMVDPNATEGTIRDSVLCDAPEVERQAIVELWRAARAAERALAAPEGVADALADTAQNIGQRFRGQAVLVALITRTGGMVSGSWSSTMRDAKARVRELAQRLT